MKVEEIALSNIIPDINNARNHDEEQIKRLAAAIDRYGFNNPIVINQNKRILSGHARYEAAKQLQLQYVPCLIVELNHHEQQGYAIADNKLSDLSKWNREQLKQNLSELEESNFDLSLTGFSEEELCQLDVITDIEKDGLSDADSIPSLDNKNSLTRKRDYWMLGNHRLICEDSTKESTLETLLEDDDNQADMVLTDPPYLMSYTGAMSGDGTQSKAHASIQNDNLKGEAAEQFLDAIAQQIKKYCHGAWYVFFYRLGIDQMMNALNRNQLTWRNQIIWQKNSLNLSNSDYKALYEPCIFGWQDDYVPALYGWNKLHQFYGNKGEVDIWNVTVPSIWQVNKEQRCELHPTMKPVALCERAIKNSSRKTQTVLDLFGGSGSTLMACEKLNRFARVVELEPAYCDVIVKRWQAFTGQEAVNITQGKTFAELELQKESA